MMKAYFAAGCFWGIEKKFSEVPGVVATAVGYMGGAQAQPSYAQVCSGESGHAEVVEIEFEPRQVSYQALLEYFWQMHNPTSLNFQGWDVGSQYRSAIFYCDENQKQAAQLSRDQQTSSACHAQPIVTEITPQETFWRAEDYHQQYLTR